MHISSYQKEAEREKYQTNGLLQHKKTSFTVMLFPPVCLYALPYCAKGGIHAMWRINFRKQQEISAACY